MKNIKSSKLNNFDFLRFAFASIVLFGHSWPLLSIGTDPITRIFRNQVFCGTIAVYGFFVISGLLVTQSWQRSLSPSDYYKKRLLRIYPAFLAATLLCVVVVSPLGAGNWHSYYIQLIQPHQLFRTLRSMVMLKVLDAPTSFSRQVPEVNGSIWTVQYEFICYILVAVLGISGVFQKRVIVLVLGIAMIIALWLDALHPWLRFHQFYPLRGFFMPPYKILPLLSYFVTGVLFALYQERINYCVGWCLTAVGITVGSIFLHNGLLFTLPFAFPYLVMAFANSPAIRLQHWGKYGDFSYGIYLYAWPIQQLFIHFMPRIHSGVILTLLAFPATMLMAFLSWHIVEKPAIRKKPASHYPNEAGTMPPLSLSQ